MATKFYYAGFRGKTPMCHGMFSKADIQKYKKLTTDVRKRNGAKMSRVAEDWFANYIHSHTDKFYGDVGVIMDENGYIVIRWTRTANRWGPQWKDYKRPF